MSQIFWKKDSGRSKCESDSTLADLFSLFANLKTFPPDLSNRKLNYYYGILIEVIYYLISYVVCLSYQLDIELSVERLGWPHLSTTYADFHIYQRVDHYRQSRELFRVQSRPRCLHSSTIEENIDDRKVVEEFQQETLKKTHIDL